MAHQQQIDFCNSVKKLLPQFFSGRFVLDIGSLDINGNNQYLFDDCLYIGVDLLPGRNVDLTTKGHELNFPDESLDVIISTECFEHDQFYYLTLKNIVRMLKPGGLFLFTCATTNRPEHGTRRTLPEDAPFVQNFGEWADYYKNLDEADIRQVLNPDTIFESYAFSTNQETCDLYFWGIKKGVFVSRYDYSFQLRQSELRTALSSREAFIVEVLRALSERDEQIGILNQTLAERNEQIGVLNQTLAERDEQIGVLNQTLAEREMFIGRLQSSTSWIFTKPLRFCSRILRGDFKTAFAFLTRKREQKSLSFAKGQDTEYADIQPEVTRPLNPTHWGVLATKHTLFIAHIVADCFKKHGWTAEIMTECPEDFSHDCYLVICPQMFTKLPPGEKRIVFQMEQSVSSRWFTDSYFETLNSSLAVLEYALVNIEFMEKNGVAYPHVYYLPVGASTSYFNLTYVFEKKYDIIFYGDSNSSLRRRSMIDALKKQFNVHVVNEVFGHEMRELIRQARLVVNLHYYENALLEMPRIQECLSLGVPVVSESAQDQEDYPELQGAVWFFEQGSIPAMLETVKAALENPISSDMIKSSVTLSAKRFEFMIDRFLVGLSFLPASHVHHMVLPLPESFERIALSLPESRERRNFFENERPANCAIFDGIRRSPGWVGCGLSYSALAQHALKNGKPSLTVMEDDVLLPIDFEEKMAIINEYLETRPESWDVFAGVIASLHDDAKILSVEKYKDITFVTINKMTSTVLNVYGEKVLQLLASWDPENLDDKYNTIDRYLEAQADLRIVVTLPFLVGHREEVHSTLWGFQNTVYIDWISKSEQALQDLLQTYECVN